MQNDLCLVAGFAIELGVYMRVFVSFSAAGTVVSVVLMPFGMEISAAPIEVLPVDLLNK